MVERVHVRFLSDEVVERRAFHDANRGLRSQPPRFAAAEFEAWCADKKNGARIVDPKPRTGVSFASVGIADKDVKFRTENHRFAFKIRWGF